jgi:hypothetical protein
LDSTDRKENCQINKNKFQNSNKKNNSINNNIIITYVASASCGTKNARLIRLCFKTTAIIETAATKSTSRSNNYIRAGQPFEQVGQISDIKVLAGQKSAQKRFGGPKRKMPIEKSQILYLVYS